MIQLCDNHEYASVTYWGASITCPLCNLEKSNQAKDQLEHRVKLLQKCLDVKDALNETLRKSEDDIKTQLAEVEERFLETCNFIHDITLKLQAHRGLNDTQKDKLFHDAYILYAKYDVENVIKQAMEGEK